MEKKPVIILDTNFIIEHITDLRDLYNKLSECGEVYVTEISIKERISQKYLEMKSKYEKIDAFEKEHSAYVAISLKKSFDDRFTAEKKRTMDSYKELFGDHIIYFKPDRETLNTILDRVYKKTPPFINKDNASDKGFKDTLMWISILNYFRDLKDDINAFFISNDKGFLNSAVELQDEFNSATGKTIEIKDNNYYEKLLGDRTLNVSLEEKHIIKPIEFDKQEMRDKIEKIIDAICHIETTNYWGDTQIERTFTTKEKFDVEYVKVIFNALGKDLDDHIFENHVSAYSILALDDRIVEVNPIPMRALDAANELYIEILNKYPAFVDPFLSAVCEILNRNFEYVLNELDDEKMPF